VSTLRVACLQVEPRGEEDVDGLLDRVRQRVRAAGHVDLLLLPELWSVGYFAFDHYVERAEPLDGPTTSAMQELAAEVGVHLHLGSLLERQADGSSFNTSLVFGPDGSILGAYRKIHVFGYGSQEAALVQGGTEPVVVDIGSTLLGLAICYDLRFPELFRAVVDRGAECIAVPATWPHERTAHWNALLRARAIENLCGVIACNAAGRNGGVEICGGSMVLGPWGDVLATAGPGEETVRAEINLAALRDVRREFPALDDRRAWLRSGAA
jgi:predicted amidohydrolase